jgi:hypothetical protein
VSILIPNEPGLRSHEPQLLDFGAVQQGALGGAAQRLNRLGTRFGMVFEVAPASSGTTGRIFFLRLIRALRQGAIMAVPQPGLVIGSPGAPVVNGAGQTGSTLALRGFSAGYQVREGQFFSLIVGGRRYLHTFGADGAASGSGTLSIAIEPMLRVIPPDGATAEVAQPYIEGLISGEAVRATMGLAPMSEFPPFTISEQQ